MPFLWLYFEMVASIKTINASRRGTQQFERWKCWDEKQYYQEAMDYQRKIMLFTVVNAFRHGDNFEVGNWNQEKAK